MSPEEIINEFRAKYEKTFVFVKMPDSSEENLFHLDSVRADRNTTGVLGLSSEEFGKIQLNYGTAHTIKFRTPEVGMFQHGKDALLFLRTPRRQWKRGLCSANASIVNCMRGLARVQEVSFDFMTVAAAFVGQTYTYPQACNMLASGTYRSVAISKFVSLALSVTDEAGYMLMYWDYPIARITPQGEVKQIIEPAFENVVKQVIA